MNDDFREELEHGYHATDIDPSLQIVKALHIFCNRKFPTCCRLLNQCKASVHPIDLFIFSLVDVRMNISFFFNDIPYCHQ